MTSKKIRRYFAVVSIVVLLLVAGSAFLTAQTSYSSPPAILDPNFQLWVEGPSGPPRLMVWNLEQVKGIDDSANVNQTLIQGREAVQLSVLQSGVGSKWVYASLSQTLDGGRLSTLLKSTIGVWILKEPCGCDMNLYNRTSVILAVEANDGVHTLTFIFTDMLQGTRILLDHRIIFLPAQSGVWTFQKINITREYTSAHWTAPERMTFSIILGASSAAVGWHSAYVSQLTVFRNGLQNPLPPIIINAEFSDGSGSTPKID